MIPDLRTPILGTLPESQATTPIEIENEVAAEFTLRFAREASQTRRQILRRGRPTMRKFAGLVVLIALCAGANWAQTKKPVAKSPRPATADAIKKLEQDWLDAAKASDADRLGAILADDWRGLDSDGRAESKKSYIENYKSGKSKLESFDFGAMDVKVLGTVAVVQGSDTEKSSADGQDTSGKYYWMDVFANRKGKWVVVRSMTSEMLK